MASKEYYRQYRAKNAAKLKAYHEEWRAKNKDLKATLDKEYYLQNKEKIRKYKADWTKQKRLDPQWVARQTENMGKWRNLNPEKSRRISRTHYKKHYKSNPEYTLGILSRSRIRDALFRKKNHRYGRLVDLIGCPVSHLKLWLTFYFQPGMSWANYGDWHIDHIKPCAKFDLSDPAQQKLCFHYTNLQPLWAKDNLSKGAKYEEFSVS